MWNTVDRHPVLMKLSKVKWRNSRGANCVWCVVPWIGGPPRVGPNKEAEASPECMADLLLIFWSCKSFGGLMKGPMRGKREGGGLVLMKYLKGTESETEMRSKVIVTMMMMVGKNEKNERREWVR